MEPSEKRYDVVVVGAGITGLTSAYHIMRENPGLSVLVIDRASSYAQGNTGRATAGFRDLFSSDLNFNLASSSIQFYRHVQESIGYDMGMNFVGYMFLLNEEDSKLDVLQEVKHKTKVIELGRDDLRSIGSLSMDVSGEEAGVLGIKPAFSAYVGLNCGIFEPDLISGFYFNELKEMGAEFLFSTNVEAITMVPTKPLDYPGEPFLWQDKTIGSVDTSRGRIHADFFVLATDVWSNILLDPVGIDSHMRPRKRQVFQIGGDEVRKMLTEFSVNDSGIFPFTILPYYGVHFRPAPKENQLRVCAADYFGRDFSVEDYPEPEKNYFDYSIKPVLTSYFPALSQSTLGGMWAGYYSYNTLDAHPFIFRVMNVIVATGTSGSGLMKGDAIGRVVSSVYSGKPQAVLYNGFSLHGDDLGIANRNVPRERFVL